MKRNKTNKVPSWITNAATAIGDIMDLLMTLHDTQVSYLTNFMTIF